MSLQFLLKYVSQSFSCWRRRSRLRTAISELVDEAVVDEDIMLDAVFELQADSDGDTDDVGTNGGHSWSC